MNQQNQLVPYTELEKMSKALGYNKMFGKTAEDLLPLMLIAQAEGKHPAIAAQEYDIIQGRPAINSKSALARFQHAGGCIQWNERTDTRAAATFSHPQGGTLEVAWTIERAKQAQLTGKDNWKKYPAQMLSSRVVAEGVRAVFPACLSGMYTTEEVQDFDAPRTTGARVIPIKAEVVEAEIMPQDDETANKLDACQSLEELQAAWLEIPVSNRRLYSAVKDSVKYRLSQVQEVA